MERTIEEDILIWEMCYLFWRKRMVSGIFSIFFFGWNRNCWERAQECEANVRQLQQRKVAKEWQETTRKQLRESRQWNRI